MTGTWLLGHRNLGGNRIRLIASVGGVALALSLTLALDAIYAGVANQLTTYIDRAGADVWVSQSGVRNMHMVASWLPAAVSDEVSAVDGVGEVTPILYATDTVAARDERTIAYVIGLPADAAMGTPWDVVKGSAVPGPGEVIVDAAFAERAGVSIGGSITVLGGDATVVGLSEGTASLVNSVAFVSFDDFASMRGAPLVSYVLVEVTPGADPEAVAAAVERQVSGVTAQSAAAFAVEERRLVMDMSAEVILIMNVVGFVVGLTVVALTVYVATVARRREYGALKALGATNRFLYGVVLGQAFVSVAIGFAAGLAFTALVGVVVAQTELGLQLWLSAASIAKVGLVATTIAGLAALLPIRQIAGLDPAVVFRRGAAP
jgi:putative ABC transport system permease protein